jgi:hypothetical protein
MPPPQKAAARSPHERLQPATGQQQTHTCDYAFDATMTLRNRIRCAGLKHRGVKERLTAVQKFAGRLRWQVQPGMSPDAWMPLKSA